MYTEIEGKYNGSYFGDLISDEGLTSNLFRKDNRAYKVFNNDFPKSEVFKEAFVMSLIEKLGIKSPRPYSVFNYNGNWIIEMEYIEGGEMLEKIKKAIDEKEFLTLDFLIDEMVQIQYSIHTMQGTELPSFKQYIINTIKSKKSLSMNQKNSILEALEKQEEKKYIVHGDFHPINILYKNEEPIIIDWATAGYGNPLFDVARTYLNLSYPPMKELQILNVSQKYFDAYSKVSGIEFCDIRKWFPIVAGFTSEGRDKIFCENISKYLPE